MKLLFDENLSPKLAEALADLFPGSVHVRQIEMRSADDERLWAYAAVRGFTIVSKDDDFRQRSLIQGPAPKVIGLLLGNCTVEETARVLRNHAQFIPAFADDETSAYMAVGRRGL